MFVTGGGDKRRRTEISERPSGTGRSIKKIMPTRDYKESLFEDLKDPEFVVAYLNAALEEETQEVFYSISEMLLMPGEGLASSRQRRVWRAKLCTACSASMVTRNCRALKRSCKF